MTGVSVFLMILTRGGEPGKPGGWKGKKECKYRVWSGSVKSSDHKSWDNELTSDQTGERLDDPPVPLSRERTLLNLRLHPKYAMYHQTTDVLVITSWMQGRLWVTYTSIG